MSRSRFQLSFIAIVLFAPVATARAVIPQQTGGGSGGRVSSVQTQCVNCGSARDSVLRQRLEQLVLKSDSLRRQIDSVPRSSAERERLAIELNRTVLRFRATLDELMNATTVVSAQAPGVAAARSAPTVAIAGPRMAPRAVAMSYESWKPRGYLGVTFEYGQPAAEFLRDGEQYIRFYQYPKIALVEPSSPAERAGIIVGDTLLELNGTDVRKEISLTRLLIPDARITVRVRRDGDAKDLRVVVLESPEYYERRAIPLPRSASRAPQRIEVYAEPPGQMAPTPAPRVLWISSQGLAGARLQTINEGLGKTLGVREGVLVLEMTPGPLYTAGVRDGDVILKAGGRTVPHVRALQQILLESDGEEGVKLVIRRDRKEREITLHWSR